MEPLDFKKIINGLRLTIQELHRTENNINQKIIHFAEKLREKHFKRFGKKHLPHHAMTYSKPEPTHNSYFPAMSPWTYLVLLKNSGALALRINYPGSKKEHLILLSETE